LHAKIYIKLRISLVAHRLVASLVVIFKSAWQAL
jgi:hypothetical protein